MGNKKTSINEKTIKIIRQSIEDIGLIKFDSDTIERTWRSKNKEWITSEDLNYPINDTFFIIYNNKKSGKTIQAILNEEIKEKDDSKTNFYFIEIHTDRESYYKANSKEQQNEQKKELFNVLKHQFPKISRSTIKINVIFSPNIEKTTAKISIEDRIRSLEIEDEKSNLKSYVVTASLKDLVTELYDKLGNQLFKKNIRIGISNDNEVDTYIGSTLGKENEKFWFYNNGISLYIPNNAQFQMRFNNILYINDIEGVSVLNGAQTLTAVAQKLSELNVENNEFNPKVILRIYTFTDSQINDEHIIDRITISLNRQKPIKIDDIAYTTDFVAYVNGYFNTDENKISDKSKFSFVRRGERTSQNDHQYHLIDFARVKLALLGKPGHARSMGRGQLLKIELNNSDRFTFVEKEIFKYQNEITNFINDDTQTGEFIREFNDEYGSINKAFEIFELLQGEESQSIFKSYDSNQNVASLEKYGNYFLLSIYMKSQDVNKEGTFNDNLKILIDKFLEFTNTDVFKEKWDGKLLESNSFKTNDLYEDFKNFIEKN